ncbi:MAG: hypothetical protein CFE24_13505 [Flavobacterium sp. BFFFF2]|nr:MAG: hypothetical protein CFE24_13505 [Flavobacterium sp. BFFFF2]
MVLTEKAIDSGKPVVIHYLDKYYGQNNDKSVSVRVSRERDTVVSNRKDVGKVKNAIAERNNRREKTELAKGKRK